jgi:hypothetical protein
VASVPPDVSRDLSDLHIVRTFPSVGALPLALKRALARGFVQPRLELANPGARYKEMSGITFRGDPEAGLPERRLRLAFETPQHYVVYYEMGHPWHAAVLVFQKSPVQFVWAGGDMTTPYANSPTQLRQRILQGKLFDGQFFW